MHLLSRGFASRAAFDPPYLFSQGPPYLRERCRVNNLIPAELPGVIHVGPGLDVAFVRVVDGGGAGVGSAQYENEAVQTHCWSVFVI